MTTLAVPRGKSSLPKFTGAVIRKLAMAVLSIAVFAAGPAFAAKYAGIVMDANTGKVLYSHDADSLRYPASLTKMMTLYLVFEALESGRIRKSTPIPMSAHAAGQAPSKLGLPAGQSFTVEQGILAIVTRSANDVAMAFAEYLGGSEAKFGRMMTAKGRALGMRRTFYDNPNGLPDPRQVTTAHDQAILGIALRQHFPQYYGYFSTRSFRFGRQRIGNHNHLLGKIQGVDGIKTGYTRAAGFNLATSVKANGRSLVVVVLGERSGRSRDAHVAELVKRYLPSGKAGVQTYVIAKAAAPRIVDAPVPAVADRSSDGDAKDVAVEEDGEDGLPADVPVPGNRYNAKRLEMAYAGNDAPAPVVGKKALAAELTQMAKVEAPKPAAAAAPIPTNDVGVDDLTTSSTRAEPAGWVIQVGAAPNQDLAKELLQKAQEKGGRVLRTANAYTVAFNADGGQVYRARFGGFHSQNSAVKACKLLKRHGMGCWASMN